MSVLFTKLRSLSCSHLVVSRLATSLNHLTEISFPRWEGVIFRPLIDALNTLLHIEKTWEEQGVHVVR